VCVGSGRWLQLPGGLQYTTALEGYERHREERRGHQQSFQLVFTFLFSHLALRPFQSS
jgi:hypothetical protein